MTDIHVKAIANGTVIDHITKGNALRVLKILGIDGPTLESAVSVVMHVPSDGIGHEDLVKLEDKELKKHEVDKIALIAPEATINIIREETVISKSKVELPDIVVGIVRCTNPNCITNKINIVTGQTEPLPPEFTIMSKSPVALKCNFCDRFLDTSVMELI